MSKCENCYHGEVCKARDSLGDLPEECPCKSFEDKRSMNRNKVAERTKICDHCGKTFDLDKETDFYEYKMFTRRNIAAAGKGDKFHRIEQNNIFLCDNCSDKLICEFVRKYENNDFIQEG